MIYKLSVLILIVISLPLNASEINFKARNAANKIFAEKSLVDLYARNSFDTKISKSMNLLLERISKEVSNRLRNHPNELMTNDYCHSSCIEFGTSGMRFALSAIVSSKISYSKETRQCQQMCKLLFSQYINFLEGYTNGQVPVARFSPGCDENVSSETRKNKTGSDNETMERAAKEFNGISK